MVSPLRSYLMTRLSSGSWSVGVFRDLEGLLAAWKSRPEPNLATGVLHVGFDRPPSSSFETIAASRSGQMLLTGAARYALPADFIASSEPIGHAAGLPVFAGLKGWGYVREDVLRPGEETTENVINNDASQPVGWVREFISSNDDDSSALVEANIWSEESYLLSEQSLDTSLRIKLARHRMSSLVPRKTGDPCEFARACPPWLLSRRFDTMNLAVRASNVLITQEIDTVGDLAEYDLNQLLRMQNFGRKSAVDIFDALNDGLKAGPFSLNEQISTAGDSTLLSGIRRSLLNLKERERAILTRRMGLDGDQETLQQIADDYDITRERIRQIESRLISRFQKDEFWDDLLDEKLARLLVNRAIPLPLLGIRYLSNKLSADFMRRL